MIRGCQPVKPSFYPPCPLSPSPACLPSSGVGAASRCPYGDPPGAPGEVPRPLNPGWHLSGGVQVQRHSVLADFGSHKYVDVSFFLGHWSANLPAWPGWPSLAWLTTSCLAASLLAAQASPSRAPCCHQPGCCPSFLESNIDGEEVHFEG